MTSPPSSSQAEVSQTSVHPNRNAVTLARQDSTTTHYTLSHPFHALSVTICIESIRSYPSLWDTPSPLSSLALRPQAPSYTF
jgi:hypothetical protein